MEERVNHPAHYLQGNRETIEVIKDVTNEGFEPYCVGNIVKYVCRYKHKNGVEDLKKAKWYLERLITEVENENCLHEELKEYEGDK